MTKRLQILLLTFVILGGLTIVGVGQLFRAHRACDSRKFEGSDFLVCAYRPDQDQLRLFLNMPDGHGIRRLRNLWGHPSIDRSRVRFAMNAGMYDQAGTPIGLYIEDGTERRPVNVSSGSGNFFLKPNGVLSVDDRGQVRIDTTDAYLARASSPKWATQSGPMLLINGALHPSINNDGASRFVRNAVGVCGTGDTKFVISSQGISFGRLARFFRDSLHCSDALYLDGAVSSLWEPSSGRLDDGYDLGPILVVTDK